MIQTINSDFLHLSYGDKDSKKCINIIVVFNFVLPAKSFNIHHEYYENIVKINVWSVIVILF